MHHLIASAAFVGTLGILAAIFKPHALFMLRWLFIGILGLTLATGPTEPGLLRYLIDGLRSAIAGIIQGQLGIISVKTFGAKGDNSTDDSGAFQKGVNFCAGTGIILWAPAATYVIGSPVTIPNGRALILRGYGATLRATMIGTGPDGFTNCIFLGEILPSAASTTLSMNATKGTRVLNVVSTTTLAIGQTILVEHTGGASNLGQQFTILGLPGGGVVNVDDPIEWSWLTSDIVTPSTCPQRVFIEGFTFTGTGDRAVELSGASQCVIQDCVISRSGGSFTSITMSFDVGGRDNLHRNNEVDGGGSSAGGLGLESQVRSGAVYCRTHDMLTTTNGAGIFIPSAARVWVAECEAWACGFGLILSDSGASDTDGPMRCSVVGGSFYSNVQGGMYLQSCKDTQIEGVSGDFNMGIYGGMLLSSGLSAGPCINLHLNDVSLNDNTVNGILWQTSGHRVTAANLSIDRSGGDAVYFNGTGTFIVTGFTSEDANIAGAGLGVFTFNAAADLTVVGGRARKLNSTATWTNFTTVAGAATLMVDDYVAELAGGGGVSAVLVVQTVCNVRLGRVRTVGALGFGLISLDGAAATLRILPGSNFQSCGSPTAFDGSIQVNRGTVTANGTTAVPIAFADIGAEGLETVKLTCRGATPLAYLFSQTPGTGFSIKSSGGHERIRLRDQLAVTLRLKASPVCVVPVPGCCWPAFCPEVDVASMSTVPAATAVNG